ncbi:MAG TPA: acyltransferase [Pseudonocardiaceae bacterium]|nr:acyltransferase [Pseudonocardiaceae bacterium]
MTRRLVFVDLGRAVGVLLVVYSDITAIWGGQQHHISSSVLNVLDSVTRTPLHLSEQGVGQVAVPLFFLISGFVVTPVGIEQGRGRFALRRAARIYPLLAVAVVLAAVLVLAGRHPLRIGAPPSVTPVSVLTNITLLNYFLAPPHVLVAVAWTLAVELVFYVLLVVLVPLFRRSTVAALGVESAFVAVLLATSRVLGPDYHLFAVTVSFLPAVIIGQVCWAARAGRITRWVACAYGVLAWALYIAAELLDLGRSNGSYDIALAYAIVLFVVGMLVEPRLRPRRWITFLADRGYAIYLLHGVVLFPLLDVLTRYVPLLVALLVGLAVTLGVVELAYRFVDVPSRRMVRTGRSQSISS